MAACVLAQHGVSTVVIEKEKLPREKACGGAMPARVRELLPWDFEHLIEAKITTQHHHRDNRNIVKNTSAPMLLVERPAFDQHLIHRALESGEGKILLYQEMTVKTVSEGADNVTLSTACGRNINARFVIAGDGAVSNVARSLGLFRKPSGAAIDAALLMDADVFEQERHHAVFDSDCIGNHWADGYGWVFPKGDHLSCGVGLWRRPGSSLSNGSRALGLKAHLHAFISTALPAGSIKSERILAHPVPVFNGHNSIASKRTCLVGDAAHLVDPVVGEGIAYALESGRLAAELVSRLCINKPIDSLDLGLAGAAPECGFDVLNTFARDCRIYQHIIRHGIARRLNLTRLAATYKDFVPFHIYDVPAKPATVLSESA